MSEPTLNPTGPVIIEWGRTVEHDAELEALVDDGLLVPVEPDYEAAAINLWYQERYGNFRDARPEEQKQYRRRAKDIVGFAYRLGGDDE